MFNLGLIETRMSQLHKEANYFKICRLLIGKGGNAFRGVLQTKINGSPPPSTLDSLLNSHKLSLHNLRFKCRVITPTQWDLLFPASGSSDSTNFDITLLTILLRNVCGLDSPTAGWNAQPLASDTSISAEILRIKTFRNDVYAHLPCPELDDTEFERLWREISKPLIKLGIPQHDIDELEETPLSREEEIYKQKLKEWKERDGELISKLNEEVNSVKKRLTNVEKQVVKLQTENVKSSVIDQLATFGFKGKREELIKKFRNNTRIWFFEQFQKWLTDNESRVMILTAGPGVGKSVLSARICELYEKTRQLAACHFCDFRTSDSRDPYMILQSLASQMCDNVHGFRNKLSETLSREHSRDSLSGTFRVLLNDPLQALNGRTKPMLIVLDALDESKTPIKSELLDLISDQFSQLPKWIKIFISSRPELQVREKLEHLNPVEIRPDDDKHNFDLKIFFGNYFPSVSETVIQSLVSKCEGSFLYAYYLVKEIKRVDSGNNPDVNVDIPKGISGFYEKQFERLKKDLKCYEDKTGVSIFENFINVVGASEEPLPFRFLFACMDLFGEQFEVRKKIVGVMSEILPVYDDCLTVFHKSLWDWLKLDGYEEHAYAADVEDGKRRLWRACKKVYTGIDSLSAVSDFEISPEKKYALENGLKYFVNVDGTEDWEWLLDVKVNYSKLYCLEGTRTYWSSRLLGIFKEYKLRIPDDVFWRIFRLYIFLKIAGRTCLYEHVQVPNMYLQYLVNKQFFSVHNANSSMMVARKKLDETNTIWLEQISNETDFSFKIISNTFLESNSLLRAISASPDNNLLVIRSKGLVKVYELPSLKSFFEQDLDELSDNFWESCIVFSPDSSYFLLNSLRTCISVKNQSIVPFIPRGPVRIFSSSFSSCGTKLVSVEKHSIKVWDVIKKELLTESLHNFIRRDSITCFSGCMSYIFLFDCVSGYLNVFDSTALNILQTTTTDICSTKLDDCIQLISPLSSTSFYTFNAGINIECWQLTTGQNILCTNHRCSVPFVWKGRKCVLTLCLNSALVVYDYFNQQVIDTFQIRSSPSSDSIKYIENLGENNFLIGFENHFVFVVSLERSSVFPAFSFINDQTYPTFCAVSPDDLYVACRYGSPILRIMKVDNGKTLQTVAPKQKPVACWWSKLYLWVVCEGSVVVKYPYTSTHRNVVGNCAEECSIDCDGHVRKFEEGVFVCRAVNGKISISKIYDKNLSRQQILDSKLDSSCVVAISSDGCAVLLYDKLDPYLYELWELGSENKWQLHSTGELNLLPERGYLVGKQNSRSLLWLFRPDSDLCNTYALCSIDFSDATPESIVRQLSVTLNVPHVIHVDSKLLICGGRGCIYFIRVADGAVITSFYVGIFSAYFFVHSKRLLLMFPGDGVINHYKIHNIDKYLPPK